jgi:quercetin dioxygenase-like cupin family protein
VQSGQIDFEYDGERFALQEGDALYFDGNVPHRIVNDSHKPATVLCVFSEPLE